MIIAERILRGRRAGLDATVSVILHAPEKDGDGWKCRFDIGWPEGKAERWGAGYDAVQALLIALQMIGTELYSSDHHANGDLVWLESGAGYGFPVAQTIRDQLVGDDKNFL